MFDPPPPIFFVYVVLLIHTPQSVRHILDISLIISLLDRLCVSSKMSMSFRRDGLQACIQYSASGVTVALNTEVQSTPFIMCYVSPSNSQDLALIKSCNSLYSS